MSYLPIPDRHHPPRLEELKAVLRLHDNLPHGHLELRQADLEGFELEDCLIALTPCLRCLGLQLLEPPLCL